MSDSMRETVREQPNYVKALRDYADAQDGWEPTIKVDTYAAVRRLERFLGLRTPIQGWGFP